MNKYDIQIDINATNESHAMILRQVQPNSSVLEFGPAAGAMTRYMCKSLECDVCIVEVDEQAFEQAHQWAVDGVCGNIEDYTWVDKFCDKKFDYILFADVLEHLSDPHCVLSRAKALLKENGHVIVSVPNIAHFGILAGLCQNQFQYRETGLLDKTHIHFFAYYSLVELFKETGYHITVYDATHRTLQHSEFEGIAPQLTPGQYDFLMTKSLGDVYQFIFTAVKNEHFEKNQAIKIQNTLSISKEINQFFIDNYHTGKVYFDFGMGFSEENCILFEVEDGKPFHWKIQLPEDCKSIRFDPIEGTGCLVWNPQIRTESTFLRVKGHNGAQLNDVYIFRSADPQIYVEELPVGSKFLNIDAEIIAMNQGAWIKLVHEIEALEQRTQEMNQHLQDELDTAKIQITRLQYDISSKSNDLALIYNSRCYRLILKYYRFKDIVIPKGSRRFIAAKILFRFPRYIMLGYPVKMLRYVRYNGFRGLGAKIREKVLNQSVPTPALMELNLKSAVVEDVKTEFSIVRHAQSVDIIICVHNAYEDVKLCIESVFEFTTPPYNIIIVDDGSAAQTRDYLASIRDDRLNVSLIRNEVGRGYTFAANMGLRASTGEFAVLLNSDTIVTAGWLDKMIMCAQSKPDIGIVGPLSNTASWQSVPEISDANGDWCHNDLPEGYSIAKFAQLLEECSAHLYMEVPLVNGFCLMIRRSVIEQIGYFDEENFGQGYGEEDDFNLRAFKAGIKLAIADDTYIFHAQSKSYSDEKRKALCQVSGRKVRVKHGDQLLDWAVVQMRDSQVLLGIRARSRAMTALSDLRTRAKEKWEGKRLLFILPIADAGGGGNVIAQEALAMQKMGVDVWIYNLEHLRHNFEKNYPELQIPVIYGSKLEDVRKYAEKFDAVCASINNSVKHVNFSNMRKAPKSMYYVQDYEPYFYPTDSEEYHEAEASYTIVPDLIRVTKTKWNADEVEKRHHVKCSVIGPSVNIDLFRPRRQIGKRPALRIAAMIRPASPRRAPKLTMEVLREVKLRYADRVEIVIFGSDIKQDAGDTQFFNSVQTDFAFENYGKLNPQQMAVLLADADVFVDFSTFQAMGLAAMEAMACGCAVIVPRAGGTTEFAKHQSNSMVVDTASKQACLDALAQLIDDPDLRRRISNQAIVDMCQYAPEYSAYRFLEAAFGASSEI